jgi:class 3 adenylate cyclase/tetratricopeptide (TPR) repeat protein
MPGTPTQPHLEPVPTAPADATQASGAAPAAQPEPAAADGSETVSPAPVVLPGGVAVPDAHAQTHSSVESQEGRPAGAPEQERRIVSVLFTDMSGSTAMAEKMDPEEFTTIVNDLFAQLGACITRYEGHIDKYIGDAIMATFGAPIAHENDPERAILAALDMQETVRRVAAKLEERTGVRLRMRVGINTGEVIAGHVGSEARADYTVMGDTVNTASRLEHHAPVGGIMVSESTYRATRGMFEWRVLEPITVKGKSEALKVYEPVARAKGGDRGVRGIAWTTTPHIGRDHLIDRLVDAYRKVCKDEPQVFAAVADAGMGKSRLRHEFQVALHREGLHEDATFMLGRCLPYTQGNSYGVITSILRDYYGLDDDDGPLQMFEKLEARGADGEAVEVLIPLLTGGRVKGALDRLTPEQWQKTAYAVIREAVEREAGQRPVVLFLEDLHWIDPSSRDLLTYLIQNVRGLPVLFFLIYRPDLAEPAGWRAHPGFHREDLAPLTPGQSESLIAAILPGIDFPAGVLGQIVARAAGNPFYIEEILKSFAEGGAIRQEGDAWIASQDVDQFQVPDTVQAILRTRIDRLADQPRRVLQQASVMGRRFRMPLLAEVSEVRPVEPHVHTLVEHELIYQSEDDVYSFKNVLAQEVAYSVLLVRRRRAYHRRVADAYERLYADQLDSHADDLVHHYFQAEVWPKALTFGRIAGDRAKELYANAEAIQYYRRCLAAIDRLEEVLSSEWDAHRQPDLTDLNRERLASQRLEIAMALGEVQALVGSYDDALQTYTSALDVATAPAARAELLWRLADGIHEKRAKWQEAFDCLTRATDELKQAEPSPSAQAKVDTALSRVYWRLQRLDEARSIAETCIAQLEGTDYFAEQSRALKQLGLTYFMTGNFDEARAQFERALVVAQRTDDPREISPLHNNLAVVAFRQGRVDDAAHHFGELLAISEKTGDIWGSSNALNGLGGCAKARHELEEALRYYERSARIKQRIGDPRGVMIAYNNMAEVYGEQNDRERAIETLEHAMAIARDVSARETIPPLLRQIAEHRLAMGEEDEAQSRATEALELATGLNARLEVALNTRLLGRIDARHERPETLERLTAAADLLRELKSNQELGVTLLDLAEAAWALGQGDVAGRAMDEAEPLLAKTGTPPDKERLEALRAGVG